MIAGQQAQSAEEVVGQSQQRVWDQVAAKNARFHAQSESGTYRKVLNMTTGDAQHSISPYVHALSGSLGTDPHLVGVVVATNGKPWEADIFGDSALFRKLWPKLLRSYSADAVENVSSKKGKTPSLTGAQANAFLQEAAQGKSRGMARSPMAVNASRESRQTMFYSIAPAKAGSATLHENVLRKQSNP